MFSKRYLILGSLFAASLLTACSESETDTSAANETTPAVETAPSVSTPESETATPVMEPAPTNVEVGMTEQAVIELLGNPDITQSYSIDSLKVTHAEWNNDDGMTSVQFQNGEVKFYQNVPKSAE
jgi:outer membrane protein assembly factor BamE (lipoprotein component of BamABCDE complex)